MNVIVIICRLGYFIVYVCLFFLCRGELGTCVYAGVYFTRVRAGVYCAGVYCKCVCVCAGVYSSTSTPTPGTGGGGGQGELQAAPPHQGNIATS